jgi:hypothetical protein
MCGKIIALTGFQSLGHPASSESLYRLSYPGSKEERFYFDDTKDHALQLDIEQDVQRKSKHKLLGSRHLGRHENFNTKWQPIGNLSMLS